MNTVTRSALWFLAWVDKRTFFCQLGTCSHLEINPLTSKEEGKGLSFWEMSLLICQAQSLKLIFEFEILVHVYIVLMWLLFKKDDLSMIKSRSYLNDFKQDNFIFVRDIYVEFVDVTFCWAFSEWNQNSINTPVKQIGIQEEHNFKKSLMKLHSIWHALKTLS